MVKIPPMNTWKERHHIWFLALLLMAVIPLARTLPRLIPSEEQDDYEHGMLIYKEKGLTAARDYWREAAGKGSLSGIVGEATGAMMEGDREESLRLAEYAAQEAEGITRARALFILGHLNQSVRNCQKVAMDYLQALQEYEQLNHDIGVFQARVRLIETYLACGRNLDARGLYRTTVEEIPKGINAPRLWLSGANLHWTQEQYQTAVGLARRALEKTDASHRVRVLASVRPETLTR